MTEIQTISTLPADFRGRATRPRCRSIRRASSSMGRTAGMTASRFSPSSPETGKLSLVGIEPTQGKNPRNFAIDPTGTYLLAENGDSGTIVVFRIDAQSGTLRPTGQSVRVPKPVCIKMIPKPAGATPLRSRWSCAVES